MKTFLLKIIKRFSIIILLYGYVNYIGFIHNLHVTKPTNKRFIVGEPYSKDFTNWFKWQKNLDTVSIISIGASRVLQFKSEFFAVSFYNLGFLAETPNQILDLIKLKRLKNKTLIISLDQMIFNGELNQSESKFKAPSEPSFFKSITNPKRIKDILNFKINLFNKSSSDNILKIGVGANLSLDGITNDGSYYYGKKFHGLIKNDSNFIGEDYKFNNTIDRIKKGNRRFQYGKICSKHQIVNLEKLIQYNIKNKNSAIYFFPPFAPTIQQYLKGENYSYLKDAKKQISQVAEKYNVKFFDYTYFNSLDSMYIDGFHGGAEIYYILAREMGLKTKSCAFLNHFETIYEKDLINDRMLLFN